MKILITGGTGLIGRKLCAALLAQGHILSVLSRNPATVQKKCGANVTAIATLAECDMAQFDGVINLAGAPILDARWTPAYKQLIWDSRVNLTKELVQRIAQAERKPKTLLSCSAIGFYGERGDVILDETAASGDDFTSRLCAAWEDAARPAADLGVRVCLLRTGLVLSPQGGLLGQMLLPFKLGLGTRIGNGKQWTSWIDIDDFVNLIIYLLNDENTSGPYNMTASQPVTNLEFTQTLAKILHRPAFWVAPTFTLNLILGERAQMITMSQRVMPRRVEATAFKFEYPTLEASLRHLVGAKSSNRR
ncbi:MAG: TIGR01777 family oxidoreductase [Anaerolineae bacterium]|nr:TIGR01777 family oxidoreductase [Anaerolineae bacterium]